MAYERFRFGAFTIDTAHITLKSGDAAIALRPKSYALLEYLVRNPGRLLGKDELLAAVWPGVVVTEDSLTRCVSEIRAALSDGEQQIVKTVSRRGYLLAVPVMVLDAAAPVPAAARAAPLRRRRVWALVAAGLLVPALLLVFVALHEALPAAPPFSVAVLPFTTAPGSAASAAAFTEELTGALARLYRVHVVAATGTDSRRVGREAAVRYAVEGSVRPVGTLLRVGVRLVDATTGALLWSDQFDTGPAAPGFDDAVLRLSSALDVQLLRAHAARTTTQPPALLDADDLAVQCVVASRLRGAQADTQPYALCTQALKKDPRNVRALARLAWFHANRVSAGQSADAPADLELAAGYAARALAADPEHAAAHCAQALVLEGQHRVGDAVLEAERCLALNPGDATAHWLLAVENFFLHRPDQTLAHVERGMRLEPRDPRLPGFLLFKGWALLQLGRNDEALSWLRRAQTAAPESPPIALALSVALMQSGREGEARAAMTEYMTMARTRSRTIAQWSHRPDGNAAFAAFSERVEGALERAGMPP
jgi:DNA-binding winged helix-turn-helix (wHTH) protein/TolB-like protein/Flp pilus assembly protein TadD